MARELAQCVREDGERLRDAAARAGVGVRRDEFYLEATVSPLVEHLLAARPSELIGPLAMADSLWLVEVLGKRTPSLEEAPIEERARRAVADRVAGRAVARHVEWAQTGLP